LELCGLHVITSFFAADCLSLGYTCNQSPLILTLGGCVELVNMAGTVASLVAGAAAWGLSLFGGVQVPFLSGRPSDLDIRAELGPLLSPNASIHVRGEKGFEDGYYFWQAWRNPHLDAAVKVATEGDVEETIKYANKVGRPFFANSGGHGGTWTVGNIEHGIAIRMRQMNGIEIAEDGTTARLGGGLLSGEVLHALWSEGKQSTVGACECTGVVAPMLGGGHGWLQGRYGLMADNLVSARVVLANGSSVTVSEYSHSDLFWAMRGAGHNFGIVTEFEYKVYDRTPENENWAYDITIFTGGKLEAVVAVANGIIGGRAGGKLEKLGHFITLMMIPDIDPDNVRCQLSIQLEFDLY
jgi:hypothetical protein